MLNRKPVPAAFALFITAFLVSAVPSSAQELTGTWFLEAEGGRGAQAIVLELVQDGEVLSGTVTVSAGGRGGGGSQALTLEDGVLNGVGFRFSYTQSFRGNAVRVTVVGTVDGDTMEGTIEGGRGGARPFAGRREI